MKIQSNTIRHLVRTGSDHGPLIMKCFESGQNNIKYFRFLNFWTNQLGFFDIVKETWSIHIQGNSMWRLQSKLKLLAKRLSKWSREEIGDIYEQVSKWKDKVQELEEFDINNNTEQGRTGANKVHAEYVSWLSLQESLLKQKSQSK